ncbi:MAG: SigB/SigF/SigG family RNA polymerase sigma factor [Lachnospiraceae bacterium]|nr:SigB/SigF/SigG family RNA polymerase sigma factor [Lachnospiraceae bacterium]
MDETMNLIQMAHEGDKAARDRLITENMGLIWSIVRRFDRRGYEMEDLFQIGSIGLMKAIDHFDLTLGLKFSTYAVPMITGEIKRFLRDDGMIKVSRSLKELGIRINGARQELIGTLGRDPTVDELAEALGESREQIAASIESAAEVESLYRPMGCNDESGSCLIDRIPEENEAQEKLLNVMVLKDLVAGLEKRDREIILRRYFDNQTQSQVAKDLNISQVQVSRLEKKILKSMREKFV